LAKNIFAVNRATRRRLALWEPTKRIGINRPDLSLPGSSGRDRTVLRLTFPKPQI